jgi:hypothetical protein
MERVDSRLSKHHVSPTDRLGEDLVIARQMEQASACIVVQVAKMLHGFVERRAVWFRKYDIERDRRGLPLVQASEQVCEDGPRPGPLPKCAQAALVDVDDHDRTNGGIARAGSLEEVKASKPELLQRTRIPDPDG